MRFSRLLSAGAALTLVGTLGLAGCTQGSKDAAQQAGDKMKENVTSTGQAALAPAVTPVLDLLNKSEGEVKSGNVAAASTAMGGFKAIWDKAAPVIQPLAGDKWPAINTAGQAVLSTFASGAKPDAAAAGSALTGLIGPLSALIGK